MSKKYSVVRYAENGLPYDIEVRSIETIPRAIPRVYELSEEQTEYLEEFMKLNDDAQCNAIIDLIKGFTEKEFIENTLWVRILLSQMSRKAAEEGKEGIAWLSNSSRKLDPVESLLSIEFKDKKDAIEQIEYARDFLYDAEHDNFEDIKQYSTYWYNKYIEEVIKNDERKSKSKRYFRRKCRKTKNGKF